MATTEKIADYDGGAYFARVRAGSGAAFLYDRAANEVTLATDPRLAVRRVTGDATVLGEDEVLVVDAGGAATLRLLPAAGRVGTVLTVCRQSANGAVTVATDGADRIWGPGANGVASQSLSSRGAYVVLLGETATTWRVIGGGGNVQL